MKSLVNHGFDPLYHFLHFETAPNAKINGLGAALACASIDKIPEVNEHRHWLIGEYREALAGTPLTMMEKGEKDEPWVVGVVCGSLGEKNDIRDFLGKHQIETRNYFFPLHLQPVNFFQGTQTYDIELKEAERLGDCGFYLPSHHYLEKKDVAYISGVVEAFFAKSADKMPPCPRDVDWVDRTKSKTY